MQVDENISLFQKIRLRTNLSLQKIQITPKPCWVLGVKKILICVSNLEDVSTQKSFFFFLPVLKFGKCSSPTFANFRIMGLNHMIVLKLAEREAGLLLCVPAGPGELDSRVRLQ